MSQIGWVEPTTPVPPNPTLAVDTGDGTGTITNPDGTTVTVCLECTTDTNTWYQPTVAADGSVIYQLTDADGPVTGSDPVVIPAPCDGIAAVDCEDGDVVAKDCEGAEVARFTVGQTRYDMAQIAFDTVLLDENTPLGLVAVTEKCRTIPMITGCPKPLRLDYQHSWAVRTMGSGDMNLRQYYSVNGGATWIAENDGGLDSITGGSPIAQEQSFHDNTTVTVPVGTTSICRITEVVRNDLEDGAIIGNNALTAEITKTELRCC